MEHMLKLNDIKTELIVFQFNWNVETFAGESMQIGCTAIEIKNLVSYISPVIVYAISRKHFVIHTWAKLREFVVS